MSTPRRRHTVSLSGSSVLMRWRPKSPASASGSASSATATPETMSRRQSSEYEDGVDLIACCGHADADFTAIHGHVMHMGSCHHVVSLQPCFAKPVHQ